jgi:hypothetical protein
MLHEYCCFEDLVNFSAGLYSCRKSRRMRGKLLHSEIGLGKMGAGNRKHGRNFMSAFIIPNCDQMLLLTQVDLSTVASEGSVVSLINDLIDSLDTGVIEGSLSSGVRHGAACVSSEDPAESSTAGSA